MYTEDESPIVNEKKLCTGCTRMLSCSAFSHDSRSKTGLRSQCKHCLALKESVRRNRVRPARLEKIREQERTRKQKYRASHQDKCRAYARDRYWQQKRKRFEQIIGVGQ